MNLLTPLAVAEPPSTRSRPRTALERLASASATNVDIQRALRRVVDDEAPRVVHPPDLEQ